VVNAIAAGIVHLDLSALQDTDSLEANGHRVFVVVWWRDVPLGSFLVGPEELPVPRRALLERAGVACAPAVGHWLLGRGFEAAAADIPLDPPGVPTALAALATPWESLFEATRPTSVAASLGVIVCTRDRPEALARCLDALAASQRPADDIVVVDNAPSTSATRDLVAARPDVRYLLAPEPGLSRARNAGLRACHTDLVAFTDDDVLVHPGWTRRIGGAFEQGVAAVTGLVLPASLDTEAEWMFETAFGGFSQGYRPFDTTRRFLDATRGMGSPVWRLGAGANMAFRRADLMDVGGFDERLGAGAAGCSEDSEAWYRLLARGRTIRYDPRAVVFHAHRGDVEGLRRQMYLYMRGHVAALFVQFERSGHWGNLRRLAITLPRYYAGRLLRARGARGAGTLDAEMRGAAAGIGYYLAHRRDTRDSRLTAASR
jgi:GT2 family glycosyltransferase